MNTVRRNRWCRFGVLALVGVACAAPARADEREQSDEIDELSDQVEPDTKAAEASAASATTDASGAAQPVQAGEAATAFAADTPGADAETLNRARAHFEQGVEFYGEGDYRAALIELQRSYELNRTYKLLYNLGQVAYELRDYAGAERYFRDYLGKGGSELSPERRREVKQELARLRSRVATLHVTTNQAGSTVRVDDHVVVHPDGSQRVSAGRRVIRAEKAGFTSLERVVDVTGGEELKVELSFGPSLVAADAASAQGGSSRLPWVTGILSGALLVASGAVGWAAYQDISARDDALREYTTRSELDSLGDQAHTKAIVADALLGAAVVSAAVTVIVVLSSGSKADDKPAASAPIPHVRAAPTLFRF